MRYIYVSKEGGKPMNIGMNQAKRVARSADERDQRMVQEAFGFGMPRQHSHHQQLVRSRHRYYHEQHEELTKDGVAQSLDGVPQGARECARRRKQMEAVRGQSRTS
jgi:hypothetical protein